MPDGAMAQPATGPEFAGLSWHDNALYGLRLDLGDPSRGDWHADLVLDIDHIVEWLCGVDRQMRFRVAPATLTFHGTVHVGQACRRPSLAPT
jgi:hypothetical protein